MQTERQIVHVKAQFNNEFRRFVLQTLTYDSLETTLRSLYGLSGALKVKFQDDENDWVLFSTDQELLYALDLAGKPLRLQVKQEDQDSLTDHTVYVEFGRGGCHPGRGRGRKWGKKENWDEKFSERAVRKCGRLDARIQVLEARLQEGSLNSEKERVLLWRLEKLRDKLNRVREVADVCSEATEDEETTSPTEPSNTEGCGRGRGGCRRRGHLGESPDTHWGPRRGGHPARFGVHHGNHGPHHGPEPHHGPHCGPGPHRVHPQPHHGPGPHPGPRPDAFADARRFKLQKQELKANLRAARASGDQAKIQECISTIEDARKAKFEKKLRLCECKEHKRACIKALQEARNKEASSPEEVRIKLEEVGKAVEAVKKARADFRQ